MSLFSGLEVANRGLSAAQLAINVTGQNITNASDPTYSRKRIEQQAEWQRNSAYGQIGFGVEVYSINRVRDQFIDRLVNQESTRYGYFGTKSQALGRIEDMFLEPSDSGLNTLLNNFWNGWAEVANDPTKSGPREALRQTTESLITQFHHISTQLRSYKDTINDEIEAKVNRINEITEGIYRCNTVIATSEIAVGKKANDTRDQRDALLNELSQMIDVDYYEDDRGALMVTTNGHMLVSGAKAHEINVKRTELTERDGYQYSNIELSFALTGAPYKPAQGELRALMDVRDVEIPKYEEYMNDLAKSLITEVNKIHQGGYSLSGLTFIDFFDGDPDKLNAANISLAAAIKKDINNIAAANGGTRTTVSGNLTYAISNVSIPGGYNTATPLDLTTLFTPLPGQTASQIIDQGSVVIRNDTTGQTLEFGAHYTFNAAGEVEFLDPAMDTNDITISFDTKLQTYTVPQLDDTVNPTHMMSLATFDPTYRFIYENSLTIKDMDGNLLQEGKDYDIDYRTAQITFKYSATNAFDDPAGLEVIITFDYHKSGFSGHGDGDNALLMSQLRDKSVMQSDLFGRDTQTINQFYAGMLGRLGTERNAADNGLETRAAALQQLKIQQQDVMGVNLDEEMASLIKYEHTYQASARYLTTINSMLDTLLNM